MCWEWRLGRLDWLVGVGGVVDSKSENQIGVYR